MKELVMIDLIQDLEFLNSKKAQNEKNAHILSDSIEKLKNAIVHFS